MQQLLMLLFVLVMVLVADLLILGLAVLNHKYITRKKGK